MIGIEQMERGALIAALPLAPWRFKLLGYDAGFAEPVYLALIAVALALGMWGAWAALRRRARVSRVLTERFVDRLAPGTSLARPLVQTLLHTLGLALLAVALAQPECGSHAELVKRTGIDLVVALDASKSMLARDVEPSRIERARVELITLLDQLKGDRVGLVVFAGSAFIQSPLTTDYEAAKLFLRAVDPLDMPQGGTDIGGALDLSRELLENGGEGSRDRVVVLLSDGEDFGGDVGEAAEQLKASGIRVYAVGIGSEAGEPIPLVDRSGAVSGYMKDAQGNTVLTRLDRAGLAHIAEVTGGEFFYRPRQVAMTEVVERIDRLQKADLESRMTVRYEQRFQHFGVPGLALVVSGMLVRSSSRRRQS
ncbi:MAG TPA: VWA domain-containing protein [Myxococcaceae bacterium]|nr:VWA domain-containing protein [Myxococcaceae bacterium]